MTTIRLVTPFTAESTAAEVVAGIDLSGRRAIVTGGASGLGEATVARLAAAGARVVVADVDEPAAQRVAGAVVKAGGTAEAIAVDVTNEEDVRRMIGTQTDSGTIARAATRAGMTTMFEHGIAKCRAGVTSAAEVLRVTTIW